MNDDSLFTKANTTPMKRLRPLPIIFENKFKTLLTEKNIAMASMDYLDEPTNDEKNNACNVDKYSSNIFLVSCGSEEGIDAYGSLMKKFI